jgi:hypothetical protein
VQLADRRARLHAEFLVQQRMQPLVRAQRLGLPAADVQAGHQLTPQPLP